MMTALYGSTPFGLHYTVLYAATIGIAAIIGVPAILSQIYVLTVLEVRARHTGAEQQPDADQGRKAA